MSWVERFYSAILDPLEIHWIAKLLSSRAVSERKGLLAQHGTVQYQRITTGKRLIYLSHEPIFQKLSVFENVKSGGSLRYVRDAEVSLKNHLEKHERERVHCSAQNQCDT